MPKVMVVNVTHSEESRVGVLKDGTLEAFEIEALSREHLKGNIYKALVRRIHPALEAAFVDIGAERDAFLPLDEICFRNLPRPASAGNGSDRRRRRVRDLLRPGEELLVQIVKEQFGNKPPTLTTFYSLPGRYLVLLPGSDDAGISRRIEGDDRIRIREIINQLQPPEGFGIIVRTAAGFDQDVTELTRDMTMLQRLWDNVKRAAETQRAPALVYREHDLVLRTIRDYFTPDIDEIHVDNEEVFQRARSFLEGVMPGKESVLRLYTAGQPIFSAFGIESQIESIFKRRVQLRSGGSIVIDTAEALTAIDVNSGGSVRGPNPEETAFRTNIEACREITRQLRLRDIGGIIVVDFIDMRDAEHVQEVERTMREAMRIDKARHEIGRISRLGLLEISRQRIRPAAMATTYATCPMCEGHGAIRTTESAALVALRKLHNRVAQGDVASVKLSLPSDVALYLLNQKRDDLAQLEERYNARIQVHLSDKLMPHQVELEVKARPVEAQLERLAPGAVAESAASAPANGAAEHARTGGAPEGSQAAKRRRRRGGRRGRTRRAAVALGDALAALGSSVGLVKTADSGNNGSADSAVEAVGTHGSEPRSLTPATTPTDNALGPGRRRRSRGGRRHRGRTAAAHAGETSTATAHGELPSAPPQADDGVGAAAASAPSNRTAQQPSRSRTPRTRKPRGQAEPATETDGTARGRRLQGGVATEAKTRNRTPTERVPRRSATGRKRSPINKPSGAPPE
jgi:ribonuclease E